MEESKCTIDDVIQVKNEAKKRTLISIIICIIVPVIAMVIELETAGSVNFIITTISFIAVLLFSIFWTSSKRKAYSNRYKEYFVLKGLTNIFADLSYDPDSGISRDVIRDTKMMNTGDRFSSNDYISGKYKDINFCQSDVWIEEEHETTDKDGHRQTYYVTIFRGRWLIFDFNKTFKANIQVCQKGFVGAKTNTLFTKNKYAKVKMESDEFNDKFKVYAQNDHEAFYILTPSLMVRLQKLIESVKGRFLFCFVDNKLHIGLNNNKDSFEAPSVFKRIDEDKEIEKVGNDMKVITMFIDELNLDNDLFKKEN